MNAQITLLSDDALNTVAGGTINNGQGGVHQVQTGTKIVGDAGKDNSDGTGPFGISLTSALGLMIYGAVVAAAA